MRMTTVIASFFALLAMAASAQSVAEIERKLEAPQTLASPKDLAPGKRLLIRHFYSDKKLKYGDRGTALGADLGTWLGDGYVVILNVEERPDQTVISAKRVRGYFEKDQRLLFKETPEQVTFSIPKTVDVGTVFVSPEEGLLAMLPPIWAKFLTGTSAYPERPNVRRVGKDATAPKPQFKPEPEWPEFKGREKFQGNSSFTCVVDENGRVRDVEVSKPLGAGLDEKGADAIMNWRFSPATHNKQKIPVRVMIDVDFHLF
jgi:TonB family protein